LPWQRRFSGGRAVQFPRPRLEALVRPEIPPLSKGEGAERNAADANPLQAHDLEPDEFAHAADLSFSPLAKHEAQLVLVLPGYLGGAQRAAVQPQAMAQPFKAVRRDAAADVDEVLLLDRALAADQ